MRFAISATARWAGVVTASPASRGALAAARTRAARRRARRKRADDRRGRSLVVRHKQASAEGRLRRPLIAERGSGRPRWIRLCAAASGEERSRVPRAAWRAPIWHDGGCGVVSVPGSMATDSRLRGRDEETSALDRLLEAVRAGESRALVVRGKPGVGKSALLEYVVERASGCRRGARFGVSSRRWSGYSRGSHQVCAPMLDRLGVPAGSAARCACHGVRPQRAARPDRLRSVWRC